MINNKRTKEAERTEANITKFSDIYNDGDVIATDDTKQIPLISHVDNTVQMKYNTFILCEKGCMRGKMRADNIELNPGDMWFGFTSMVIEDYSLSDDFEAKIICISSKISESILYAYSNLVDFCYYLVYHPQTHLSDSEQDTIRNYYKILKHKLSVQHSKNDAYSFICFSHALAYDALSIMAKDMTPSSDTMSPISRGQILFKNFIKTLATTYPRQRSLQYYSDTLCVTSKYLSTTVKSISGRTAHQWIDEYVIEDIVRLLCHSSMSIKEIASLLGFENLSFFGKYVKKKLGVSPLSFRNNMAQ